jgi:hypothetical protein
MSVPRAPHAWMSNGVTAEPIPMDSSNASPHSQRASHQAGRDHLLQRAVDPDVVEDPGDPDRPGHQVRPVPRVDERQHDQRHSPPRDPGSEAACHRPAADEHDRKRTDEEASRPQHRGEPADAGRAQAEQVQGDDDRKDVEDSAGERLGGSGDGERYRITSSSELSVSG